MQNKWSFKLLFTGAILIVGIVYSILPHFVRSHTLKEEGIRYIPITLKAKFDHINFGGGRYRDVVDGTLIPGEIDTYEYKDGPILFPMLAPTVQAPFFLPFDSVFPGIIITDFIFPILLFITIFLILYSFTAHKYFSLFAAYVLMLFPQLPVLIPPSSVGELKALLAQFIPFSEFTASRLNFLSRESYIPGGPFFVMMFYSVYRSLTSETRKTLFFVLGGIFYGLLFYLYFFFWVFATIFLGVLFLLFIITKNYFKARTVFLVGVTGAIVSIPFWINQHHLMQLPSYGDIIIRMGVEEGYGIRWFLYKTYILHIIMAGFALYLGRIFSKTTLGYFLASIALTGIIAYNVNAVVGWTIESDHWGNKVFLITNGIVWPPLIYYGWLHFASIFKRNFYIHTKKIFSILAIIVVILLTTHVVESSIKENRARAYDYTVSTELMDAYEWLTAYTPKDSVVMTPSIETNIELAAYTHNRIFQARAQNNLLSKEEVLDRMYIAHIFFDVSLEKFYEVIQTESAVFNFFSSEYNSKALDTTLRPDKYTILQLPQDIQQGLLNTYAQYTLPQKIPYRIDYIFVGSREKAMEINEESLRQYEKLYEAGGVVIYRFNLI